MGMMITENGKYSDEQADQQGQDSMEITALTRDGGRPGISKSSSKVFLLPISLVVLLILSFIIPYIIAVYLGHVEAGFPYISDTGSYSPESCIFGQLLNICAVLAGVTMYVRYEQVKSYSRFSYNLGGRTLKINKVGIVLGYISALGVSVVGNFQESNVTTVHFIGAMMAFAIGLGYCWIHTYISYKMKADIVSRPVCHIRTILCTLVSVFLFTTFLFGALAWAKYKGSSRYKWRPEDGGFTEHVFSTASEWAMAICLNLYFLTFVKDFQKLSVEKPKICICIERERPRNESDAPVTVEET